MGEKLRRAWFEFKIFMWYLATEPWRQIRDIFKSVGRIITSINTSLTWAYAFMILAIVALVSGRKPLAAILIGLLLITILVWEFRTGFYKDRYRKHTKKRLEKEAKKNGIDRRNY